MPHDSDLRAVDSTAVHLECWKNGDDGAFAVLHARFSPLLRARVRRHCAFALLAPHLHVDDVLQEIWARAVPAARHRFEDRGRGAFFAFLGKIADRVVIDLARRHRARKRGDGGAQSLDATAEVAAGCGRAARESATSRARASELDTLAREALTERELEAWELVELQDYSTDEAGLAMRTTGSAVRGLLLRARSKLVVRISRGAD